MARSVLLLTALVLSGSVAACGPDAGRRATAPDVSPPPSRSPAPSTAPSAAPSPPPAASSTPTAAGPGATGDGAPEPFPADARADTAEPRGGPLSVRAVRVARRAGGHDRVVFELAGRAPGRAGWRVEYVDEPRQQGSGDPVDVAGAAVLSVLITGTGYPMDTGVEEAPGDPVLPDDLSVVQDVVLGSVFEGQYEAYVGTTGRVPFRVFRLGDPERVVLDVRAP
ncbi:MAG: hypothetical protein AVDCRST_MAG07-2323 [uncultured Frankineae bacterium]|uniref:AMIN-like domain-containing protein n=1 Tax=uncultured Frankineae bacterium TaxID=437475 RepID=A0A6J4LRG9_9ACTN|nr:MAG: hypothetical protein AVDCRST_MAG07-2323 [uncultured Frankineae bacterium]